MKRRGFTLIELLVVIAIIGVLSSIVLTSLRQTRDKSHDNKLVQDLIQVRNALELYHTANGRYPDDHVPGDPSPNRGIDCWDCPLNYQDLQKLIAIEPYLKTRPSASSFGIDISTDGYWYKVNPCGTDYKIAILDSMIGNGSNRYAYVPDNMIDIGFSGGATPAISLASSDTAKTLWHRNFSFSTNTCS